MYDVQRTMSTLYNVHRTMSARTMSTVRCPWDYVHGSIEHSKRPRCMERVKWSEPNKASERLGTSEVQGARKPKRLGSALAHLISNNGNSAPALHRFKSGSARLSYDSSRLWLRLARMWLRFSSSLARLRISSAGLWLCSARTQLEKAHLQLRSTSARIQRGSVPPWLGGVALVPIRSDSADVELKSGSPQLRLGSSLARLRSDSAMTQKRQTSRSQQQIR